MKNSIIFNKIHGDNSWKKISLSEYDLIIFAGNYFDSKHHTNQELIDNFKDILELVRTNSNVHLLLGRHDLQYLDFGLRIGGFREDGADDFNKILSDNIDVFKVTYEDQFIEIDQDFIKCRDISILLEEGYYYDNFEKKLLVKEAQIFQKEIEKKPFEYNYVKGYKVGIYTPYMKNLDQSVIDAQRSVFDVFDFKINQVYWEGRHAEFSNFIARNEDVDFFILFDIDAIPLRPDFLELVIEMAGKDKIVGAEQVTIHISDDAFAAPSCFIMSKDLYERMNQPDFEITDRSDDTQELTYLAQEMGIEVRLLKFTHCEKEHYYWRFKDGRKYGYGSYYEDLAYHNFESRMGAYIHLFLNKCKEIVKKYS